MVNLKSTNEKHTGRMIGIVEEITGLDPAEAGKILEANDWNIRKAVDSCSNSQNRGE